MCLSPCVSRWNGCIGRSKFFSFVLSIEESWNVAVSRWCAIGSITLSQSSILLFIFVHMWNGVLQMEAQYCHNLCPTLGVCFLAILSQIPSLAQYRLADLGGADTSWWAVYICLYYTLSKLWGKSLQRLLPMVEESDWRHGVMLISEESKMRWSVFAVVLPCWGAQVVCLGDGFMEFQAEIKPASRPSCPWCP